MSADDWVELGTFLISGGAALFVAGLLTALGMYVNNRPRDRAQVVGTTVEEHVAHDGQTYYRGVLQLERIVKGRLYRTEYPLAPYYTLSREECEQQIARHVAEGAPRLVVAGNRQAANAVPVLHAPFSRKLLIAAWVTVAAGVLSGIGAVLAFMEAAQPR